jgi:hypothetical protein
MTPAEVVERFQAIAAAHPDIAEAFVEARAVWLDAVALRSKTFAEASGIAFGRVVELVEAAQGRALEAHERDILREMLRSPVTPGEAARASMALHDA